MTDHDDIEPRVRLNRACKEPGPCPDLEAAYLDLYDEVKRLRAELADGSFYKEVDIDRLQERLEKAEDERDRLLYVLDGVAGAIDTGRNEPLQVWRDQINIARQALKGQPND